MNKIRYAVVGLGHIAQAAVLPAFAHARRNSELTAFVSGDSAKVGRLARAYGVEHSFGYEEYDACLGSGLFDAVYIALPNSEHRSYAQRALERGIHVLCEKPLTVSPAEAEALIKASEDNGTLLMTAYRLHFERGNLEAARLANSGELGRPRFFSSCFALQLDPANIRTSRELGGGPLYDLGIYCINAARYIFREEPHEVFACASAGKDRRFAEVEEMASAVLRFSDGKLAQFTCSFGASPLGWYQVACTKGALRLDNAYEYAAGSEMEITLESGKSRRKSFPQRDQFAPELLHFSDCVLHGRRPEPDGREGLIDVSIIEAIKESARTRRPVRTALARRHRRPTLRQEMRLPKVGKAPLVDVHESSR